MRDKNYTNDMNVSRRGTAGDVASSPFNGYGKPPKTGESPGRNHCVS